MLKINLHLTVILHRQTIHEANYGKWISYIVQEGVKGEPIVRNRRTELDAMTYTKLYLQRNFPEATYSMEID